ncbi:hypothetical protein ACHAQH_006088 [Verticillium albo-atrum]
MPSLGLEPVYPTSASAPSPRWRRTIDIICVHGFGRNAPQTWYHDAAGKAWVAESDFLGQLGDAARVMLYTYNADLAANMNAASIAMHATELIGLINSCCSETGGGPFIFIAHGFGGLIVKKPSRITTEDVKEYVESAKAVNTSFTSGLTRDLEIVNFVEGVPTNIAADGEAAYPTNIIPEACSAMGMGQGITEVMELFKNWMASPCSSALFITGGTGTGKTYLAKTIANRLASAQPPENPTMAFFCNAHTAQAAKPAILECFIHDLLCRKPEWFDGIPPRYEKRHPSNPKFSLETLFDILRGIKNTKLSSNTVYFIVDGLDLCDPKFVQQFVQQISSLIGKLVVEGVDQTLPGQIEPPRPRFKFLLTMEANKVPRQISGFQFIHLAPNVIKANIETYVDEFFSRFANTTPANMIAKKKTWVKEQSGCFFVAAASHCAELEEATDNKREGFQSYNETCPPSLARYYDREFLPLLQDIHSSNHGLLMMMLHVSALGPLNVTAMLDAIACLDDDPGVRGRNAWSLSGGKISRLLPCVGQGFKLIHRSLSTYIERFATRQEQHANMAAICLKYLLRPEFRVPLPIYAKSRPEAHAFLAAEYPFYEYAAGRWARHISLSEEKGLKLLPELHRFVSEDSPAYQTWCHFGAWSGHRTEACAGYRVPPCLELAKENAIYTIENFLPSEKPTLSRIIVSGRLFEKLDLPKRIVDFIALAQKSHHYPWDDLQDHDGLNMLHHACGAGRLEMVELVLKHTQNVNKRAHSTGESALFIACKGASRIIASFNQTRALEVAKRLLQAGADPNIPSHTGDTCLHGAGRSNQALLVKLLLKHGALPNISNLEGVTVIESAAVIGHSLEAVESLIDAGADVNVWCHNKRSPISGAIVEKDFDMFKLLLRGMNDINMIDGNGVGILHHQLVLERPEWLACVLERPDVNLDLMPVKDGKPGIPPVAFAAEQGYSASAEMLLAAGATPGYVPGQAELLPLYYAIQAEGAGDARLTRLLLEYGAPINTIERHDGWFQRTALSRAVTTKNESLVRMLLDYGADPTVEEGCGNRGPLSFAVKRSCPAIVRMLMEHPLPPDPNYIPTGSVHILVHAVRPGEGAEMTKLLLSYGADTKTFHLPAQEENPLHYAAGDGMADVCQALLEYDPALINLQYEDSLLIDTPLHRAARALKPQATLDCLLAAGARPDLPAFFFKDIPLHQACERGNLVAVKTLQAAAPELINHKDFYGHTPLMDACREGAVDIVAFLLQQGADITLRDDLGESCVGRVVDREPGVALRLVRLLLDHGLNLSDVVASDGFTILAEACAVQNVPVMEYLLQKGADPIRCQRGPDGTSWRTAVHLVMQRRKPKALDVLLERQDVRDHINSLDWKGRTVLHCGLRNPTTRSMVSKLYWTFEGAHGSGNLSELLEVRDWML